MKIVKNSAFSNLTKPQQRAVEMLYDGKTVKAVSQVLKVHVNTIENWKRKSEFQTAMTEYSVNVLSAMLPEAIHKLQDLIDHGRSEMVRLQAIQTVISNADKVINYNQELSQARLDKLNAETDLINARKELLIPNTDQEDKLAEIARLLREGADEEYEKMVNQ